MARTTWVRPMASRAWRTPSRTGRGRRVTGTAATPLYEVGLLEGVLAEWCHSIEVGTAPAAPPAPGTAPVSGDAVRAGVRAHLEEAITATEPVAAWAETPRMREVAALSLAALRREAALLASSDDPCRAPGPVGGRVSRLGLRWRYGSRRRRDGAVHRVIYSSRATGPFDRAALAEILATARRGNAEADVTGLLLYSDRTFLQVLEGSEEAVRATFARIAVDPRHTEVTVLVDAPTDVRTHPDWSMGFHSLDGFLADADLVRDPARAEALLSLHASNATAS